MTRYTSEVATITYAFALIDGAGLTPVDVSTCSDAPPIFLARTPCLSGFAAPVFFLLTP